MTWNQSNNLLNNKKLDVHILLWIIAYAIFLLRQVIYDEIESSDTYWVALYYFAIVSFVFLLNLINNRQLKWLILLFIYIIPISALLYFDNPDADYTVNYLLVIGAPFKIPILPNNAWQYITHTNYAIKIFYQYLAFFILPILYWVGLYYLAKKTLTLSYQW